VLVTLVLSAEDRLDENVFDKSIIAEEPAIDSLLAVKKYAPLVQ
jgi:hypothetical protein